MQKKSILQLWYFQGITIIEPDLLDNTFPELSDKDFYLSPPFDNFKEVCDYLVDNGWMEQKQSLSNSFTQFYMHPSFTHRFASIYYSCSHEEQTDFFFVFIEYQIRLINLFNEWIHHTNWKQVKTAKNAISFELKNLKFFFQETLLAKQSFLGTFGILKTFYLLTGQEEKRIALSDQVLSIFMSAQPKEYDPEIFQEFQQALSLIGDTYFDHQLYTEALEHYHRALSLFQNPTSEQDIYISFLKCKYAIVNTYLELNQFVKAEPILLNLFEEANHMVPQNETLLTGIFQSLVFLYSLMNRDYDKACSWLDRGINSMEAQSNLSNTTALHITAANLHLEFDQFEKAGKEYLKALDNYESMSDEKGIADTHNNIGVFYASIGDLKQAKFHYKTALSYYIQRNNQLQIAEITSNLAATFSGDSDDELEEHREYFDRALNIYEELKLDYKIGQVFQGLGSLEESSGSYSLAESYYIKALKIFKKYEDLDLQSELLHNLGSLYLEDSQFEKSETFLLKALSLYEKRNDQSGIAEIYQNLGKINYEWKQDTKALEYFEKALTIFQDLGLKLLEANTRWNLGIFYKEAFLYQQAMNHFLFALMIYRNLDHLIKEMEILSELGEVCTLAGDKRAKQYWEMGINLGKEIEEFEFVHYLQSQLDAFLSKNNNS